MWLSLRLNYKGKRPASEVECYLLLLLFLLLLGRTGITLGGFRFPLGRFLLGDGWRSLLLDLLLLLVSGGLLTGFGLLFCLLRFSLGLGLGVSLLGGLSDLLYFLLGLLLGDLLGSLSSGLLLLLVAFLTDGAARVTHRGQTGPTTDTFLTTTQVQDLHVFGFGFLAGLDTALLDCQTMPLALQHNRSDQTLDLGCLGTGLLAILLREWALDDELADIILLGQVVQLADVAGALRSQATGNSGVGQSGNVLLALLDDDQGQGRQVLVNDATANRLTLALSGTTWAIARVALLQQQTDTGCKKELNVKN